MLEGKKTYLSAGVIFVLGGLYGLGYITEEQLGTLTVLAGSIGMISMRQATRKMSK